MKTTARNQLQGTIQEVRKGAVNCEVILKLSGGEVITSIVTNDAAEELGLAAGKTAYAIVKATWVLLSKGGLKMSARNTLCGKVSFIQEGAVNTEVKVSLAGGDVITAIVTNEGAKEMGIAKDQDLCAVFKASSVILAV